MISKKEKDKPSIVKSIRMLWQFMEIKDKIWFVCLFLFSIISAAAWMFFNVVPGLVLASVCGESVKFLFIDLTKCGPILTVVILMVIATGLWVVGMMHYYFIDIFARKMICVVNVKAQDLVLLERENLDFGMTIGEVNYIIKNATDCVYQIIEPFCWDIVVNILSVFLNIAILFTINWIVGCIGLIMIGLILLAITIRLYVQNPVVEKIENTNAVIGDQMLTSVQNLSLITLLESQEEEREQLRLLNKTFFRHHKKRARIGFWYWIAVIVIEYSAIAAAVATFLVMATSAQIIASITMIFTILADVYSTIEGWGFELGNVQSAAVKLHNLSLLAPTKQRLLSSKKKKQMEIEREGIHSLEVLNYKVQFGKFSHEYYGKFEEGNIYLLSGQSGCGKTTLLNVLCGLKKAEEGGVVVNNKYSLSSLAEYKNKISYMLQDAVLFNRSIEKNIAYPNKELNEEGKRLVDKFQLQTLIKREGQGIDVKQTLSGGEKKRIDFIRTLSKEADVYLLDEPTNDLDKNNVDKVIDEIKMLKSKGKIVIIISHDKRIASIVDEVIEL